MPAIGVRKTKHDQIQNKVVLFEDKGIVQSLGQMCARFSPDPAVQADLMQECRLHLWRIEREKPNQTKSWYLQSCRFHVQHWLSAGRSVDNPRRANNGNCIPIDISDEDPTLGEFHTNGDLFESICFQDTVSILADHLGQRHRQVLNGLVDGWSLSDIASRSRISYPTVLKYRSLIAHLTEKLGIR